MAGASKWSTWTAGASTRRWPRGCLRRGGPRRALAWVQEADQGSAIGSGQEVRLEILRGIRCRRWQQKKENDHEAHGISRLARQSQAGIGRGQHGQRCAARHALWL